MSPGRAVGGRRADGTGAAYGNLAAAAAPPPLFLAGVENEVLDATITILLSVTVFWVAPGVLSWTLPLAAAAGKLSVIT